MNEPKRMDNLEVAAVFKEMGELMLIQGGDPYRARAFSRTAGVIEGLREPIGELLKLGRAERLAGIGPGSVERIKQILTSGTCADHQRLLARIPVGLRDVIKVRGMGVRTARLAYEHLGVTDLASLRHAAQVGALARVPGFSSGSVARILIHLDELAGGPVTKLLLSEALTIGDRIVAWLKDEPACTDALQTGSARRRQEVIGDLDFVAGATDPGAVARRFTSYPGVKTVLSGGDGFAIVLLSAEVDGVMHDNVQADLRIVDAGSFGAGVHHFTGNKQHNIVLRIRGHRRGVHISEKGVWERKLQGRGRGDENRKIARRLFQGKTEDEIFTSVGLPHIPVELRTGDGELKAADEGRLPNLVDAPDLKGDLHLRASDVATTVAMLHAAKARNLEYVALVCPNDPEVHAAARAFEERAAMRVFLACEVPLGADAATAAGSAPPHALWAELLVGTVTDDLEDPTPLIADALAQQRIDILARPLGRTLPRSTRARTDVYEVLRSALHARIPIEMSGNPRHLDLDSSGAKLAIELGVTLSIASAATTAEQVADVRFALWQARRGWVSATSVLNTRPLAEVEAWVATRKRAPRSGAHATAQAAAGGDRADLRARLERGDVDADLFARIERFLKGEADAEIEKALLALGGNALQAAFEILAKGPRT